MARKPTNWWLWTKMIAAGGVACVGGPALVMWVSPTDEQLFERYSPELKKKSLERRFERQKEFDDFVNNLKEYSKSDKPIWAVQQEAVRQEKETKLQESLRIADEVKARKEEMRKQAGLKSESKTSSP